MGSNGTHYIRGRYTYGIVDLGFFARVFELFTKKKYIKGIVLKEMSFRRS